MTKTSKGHIPAAETASQCVSCCQCNVQKESQVGQAAPGSCSTLVHPSPSVKYFNSIMFMFCRYNVSETVPLPKPATFSSTPALPPSSLVIDPALLGPSISRNATHATHSHLTVNLIVAPAQAPKANQGMATEQVAVEPFTEKEIENGGQHPRL
jgi:hypothetical protein